MADENVYNKLHTHFRWFEIYNFNPKFELKASKKSFLEKKRDALLEREEALYKKYGFHDFKKFFNWVVGLIDVNDAKCLDNFTAVKLINLITKVQNNLGNIDDSASVDLYFDFSNFNMTMQELQKAENKMWKALAQNLGNGKVQNKVFSLTFNKSNIKGLKEELNKYFDSKLKTSGKGALGLGKTSEIIGEIMSKGFLKVKAADDSKASKDFVIELVSGGRGYPWNYTIDKIKEVIDSGDKVRIKILYNAIRTIYKQVMALVQNGSDILKKAAEITWRENICDINHPSRYLSQFAANFAFGQNLGNGIKGALGEFQAALIFNYIRLKAPNPGSVKIVGSIVNKYGEKGKQDVQLFNEFGIQVKNYNIVNSKHSDIATNIHPGKLAQSIEASGNVQYAQDLTTFLANYYFHPVYQKVNKDSTFKELEASLDFYLAEIMSFDLGKQIDDTISFYVIGGRHLVPGSEILQSLIDNMTDGKAGRISITSGYTMEKVSKTDEQLMAKHRHYWKESSSYNPSEPDRPENWETRPANSDLYDKLINSQISIRNNFNYKRLINDNNDLLKKAGTANFGAFF